MIKQGKILLLTDFVDKNLNVYPITLTDAVFDSKDKYTSLTDLLDKKLDITTLQEQINQALKQAKESGQFNGANGANGLTAYELAVQNGFSGTEKQWLNSLKAHTPIKGKDYWTTQDQQQIINEIIRQFTHAEGKQF